MIENCLVSHDVTLLLYESAKFRGRVAEDLPSEKMPMFCVVYGCSTCSNQEKGNRFYRVPKTVIHKGEKCKKLTEQLRKKWLLLEEQSLLMPVSAVITSSEVSYVS